MRESIIQIKGMHCPSCEILIEDALGEQKGIIKLDVSHTKGVAVILFDESKITEDKLRSIIKNEGYEVK